MVNRSDRSDSESGNKNTRIRVAGSPAPLLVWGLGAHRPRSRSSVGWYRTLLCHHGLTPLGPSPAERRRSTPASPIFVKKHQAEQRGGVAEPPKRLGPGALIFVAKQL